jgi:hypothetical protein
VARVAWQITGAAGLDAAVERRQDQGEWGTIGTASADGTERVAYADDTVEPGHDYGYRLTYRTGEGLQLSPEAVVHVPLPELAIGRVSARGSSALEVAFTLPGSAPASLDLIDVSGRRVAARAVGALGPGTHTVTLEGGSLAPGIYFVRLRQGNQRAVARAALTR